MTRHVRDSAYWGMPVGTPIVKGMKPVKARQRMANAVKAAASPGGGKVPGLLARNAAANPPRPSSRGTAAQRMAAGRPGGAWAAMAAARGGGEKRTQVLASDGNGGFKPAGTISRGDAAKIMHGPTGKPAARKAPAKPKAPTSKAPTGRAAKVEAAKADIVDAMRQLHDERSHTGGINEWIGLADLRDRVGDRHNREDFDQAIRDLSLEGGQASVLSGIPVANRKGLKPRDRAATVMTVAGEESNGKNDEINAVRLRSAGEVSRALEPADPADANSFAVSKREQLAEVNARRASRGMKPMDRSEIRDYFPGLTDSELDDLAGGAKSTSANSRAQQVEDDIRSAVADLAGEPGGYVSLEDVRTRLGSRYARSEVDQALDDMFLKPGVALTPEANQKTLTPGRRAAAVNIGAQDQHLISISGVGGAKPAPAKTAKKATTARAKMASAKSGLPGGLTPQGAVDQLKGMNTRADGEQLLAKASRADLAAILDAGKIVYPKSGNKPVLLEHIIESLIGRRIDHTAILRATGSERYTR